MLTIDEANAFLTNQLKFANWREVIERDKFGFLKLLVPYYAHNIYFQVPTIKFFFKDMESRLLIYVFRFCFLEYHIIFDFTRG